MTSKIVIAISISFPVLSHAVSSCPLPSSAVEPNVSAKVTFDSKKKLYEYRYSITNASNSSLSIDHFGLYIGETPNSIQTPENWNATFISNGVGPSFFHWGTIKIDPKIEHEPATDGKFSPHIYAIKPGNTLSGLSFKSVRPPGVVQYFAEGDTGVPVVVATATNNEPEVDCPGWDLENPRIQTQLTGMIVGPSDPDIKSVRIRIREEKGEKRCSPIDPKKPSGKISVLVFDTRDFDAGSIDPTSTYFGPGYAKPLAWKMVSNGKGERDGGDEREHWERAREEVKFDGDQKSASRENMLLTFSVTDLDVQCGLDRALFLRGKTKTGEAFIGGASADLARCKKNQVDKHKHHSAPFKWWEKKEKK